MTASETRKAAWYGAAFTAAGVFLGGMIGIPEITNGITHSRFLEVTKRIHEVCCLNMTGQPTAACQDLFISPIKLNTSFMDSICKGTEDYMYNSGSSTFDLTVGGIFTGIGILSLLAFSCCGAAFACNTTTDREI